MMHTQILAHSVSIMTEHKYHLMQQLYAETNVKSMLRHVKSPDFSSHDGFYLLRIFGEVLGHV